MRLACMVPLAIASVACGSSELLVTRANGDMDTLLVSVSGENAYVTDDLTIDVGEAVSLAATALDAAGTPVANVVPEWDSNDWDVASVSTEGVVVGLSEGETEIVAIYAQLSATIPTSVADTSTVAPPPPPPAGQSVVFSSDWSSGTGQNSSATLDGGKWDREGGGDGDVEVVSAASEGLKNWPTTNALRVNGTNRGDGGVAARAVMLDSRHWSLPTLGETMGYRWYMNVPSEACVGSGPTDHPIHNGTEGTPGNNDWTQNVQFHNGYWTWNIGTFNTDEWPNYRWEASYRFQCDETYRIELQFKILSGGNYTIDAAVFDSAGRPLLDASDFSNINSSETLESYQRSGSFSLRGNDWDLFKMGTDAINGSEASSAGWPSRYPLALYRYGALAIVKNGSWPIGPYAGW